MEHADFCAQFGGIEGARQSVSLARERARSVQRLADKLYAETGEKDMVLRILEGLEASRLKKRRVNEDSYHFVGYFSNGGVFPLDDGTAGVYHAGSRQPLIMRCNRDGTEKVVLYIDPRKATVEHVKTFVLEEDEKREF